MTEPLPLPADSGPDAPCPSCGHGRAEARTGPGAAPRGMPPGIWCAWAGLLALVTGLACTAAGTLLGRVLGGADLLAGWLAVIIAIASLATAGHAALGARAARDARDAALDRAAR